MELLCSLIFKGCAVMRAFAFPPVWHGVNVFGLSLFVGSLLCSERFFLWVLRSFPLLKDQHLQIPIGFRRHSTHQHKLYRTLKCFVVKHITDYYNNKVKYSIKPIWNLFFFPRTILYVSIVYIIGNITVAITSIPAVLDQVKL